MKRQPASPNTQYYFLIVIILLAGVIALVLFSERNTDHYFGAVLIILIFVYVLYIFKNIQDLSYDENFVYLTKFKKIHKIPYGQIIKIKRELGTFANFPT